MNKYDELYKKIITDGNYKGIRFDDIKYLLEKTGFSLRISGDHFRYSMEGIEELINLQPDKNDKKLAKDYQVKQIRKIYIKYKLGGADHEQ